MTGPINVSGPTLPQAVAAQQVESTVIRIGKVISYDSGYIDVEISGTTILTRAAYILSAYVPAVGDYVALAKQGSQWLVMGELSSNPEENAVVNPSFETGDLTGWSTYIPAGQPFTVTAGVSNVWGYMLDGQWAGNVFFDVYGGAGTASANGFLISDPFPVEPGQLWSMSCWVTANGGASADTAVLSATINMLIYADAADTYPLGTIIDSTSAVGIQLTQEGTWHKMSNSFPGFWSGYTIPNGGFWGRILLFGGLTRTASSFSSVSLNLYFDRVNAIRIN